MEVDTSYEAILTSEPLEGGVMYSHVAKLGDMVVQLPRIRFLARRHGRPVHVLTRFKWCRDLLAGIDYIDRVEYIGQWRIPYWLSPLKILAAHSAGKNHLRWFYAGEGTALKRGRFMMALARHMGVPQNHIFPEVPEWYEPMDYPAAIRPTLLDTEPPALAVLPGELEAMRDRLGKMGIETGQDFIIVHAGDSRTQRGKTNYAKDVRFWFPDNWVKLLKMVQGKYPDKAIVMTGTAREGVVNEEIRSKGVRAVNLAGKTSVRDLIALATLAESCISLETGMAHIATTSGCPLVALFAASCPETTVFGPSGWGPAITIRGIDAIGKHIRSIDNIKPETVFRRWQELPPRPKVRPKRCVQKHYVEGDDEPNRVEPGVGRILTLNGLVEKATPTW